MKTLTLDLNKLTTDQLQAYLMLEQVSVQHKIAEDNKGWMKEKQPPQPKEEQELPPPFETDEELDEGDSTDFIE